MAGKHYLIDFYGCTFEALNSAPFIEGALLESARISKATILHHSFHKFAPQGVSGVIVIAESHISIHTWPENGYAALDLFTCGETMATERAVEFLKAVFQPQRADVREMQRGEDMHLPVKPEAAAGASREIDFDLRHERTLFVI